MKGLYNGEEVTVKTDFGISQQHYLTIKRMNFDIDLLLNDLVYSTMAGAKVLSYFYKRYASSEPNWFVRYNVGTRKSAIRSSAAREYCIKLDKYGAKCRKELLYAIN